MRKLLLLLTLVITSSVYAHAQTSVVDSTISKDTLTKSRARVIQDSMERIILSKETYPLIKSSKWSGVIPVEHLDEVPDPNQKYKLLLEVTTGIKDSAEAKINGGFAEVGRILNLHIASGIPIKNLNTIVVVHGSALFAFLKDEKYKAKFKVSNPNLPLFKELLDAGVKFIACGQAMFFFDIKREDMLSWVKVSLTAQTVLTNYQLKGYILNKMADE